MRTEDYSLMWWAHGWRGRSAEGRRILNIQTNRFGLALDVDRADLIHLGRIDDATDYASAASEGNETVFSLPRPNLDLQVKTDSGTYRCVRVNPDAADTLFPVEEGSVASGTVMDGAPSRIVASGRFVQRIDLMALEFEDEDGNLLPALGRLEMTVWPDFVGFLLEVTPTEPLKKVRIEMSLDADIGNASKTVSIPRLDPGTTGRAAVGLWMHGESSVSDPSIRVEAVDLNRNDERLEAIEEPERGWIRIPMQSGGGRQPRDWNHLDRYALTLANPSNLKRTARLFFQFEGEGSPPISGFTPILLDEEGEPSGLPVQISKNWHRQSGRNLLYDGRWFHGFAMIRLDPGETWNGALVIASAHWGGVPAASHGQLSLIGWGGNQLWDQAAIGSWGESICYDPDVTLNRSIIDDIRPLMVWGMTDDDQPRKWGWTHNVGGGDFLVYVDDRERKQFLSRMKTAYLRYGPNLTEVVYSGVTADGRIAARMTVSSPRCDDINRAYHRIRYDVLEPTPFTRIAFYQLGADAYNDHDFDKLARGDREGLIEEWTFEKGGRRYDRQGVPCEGEAPWWFSLHDGRAPKSPHRRSGGAWADRGLIVRSYRARLGGREVFAPTASFFGTEDGGIPGMNVELSPPPGLDRLEPGDFVEAELELVVLPTAASDYYGPNENLRRALDTSGGGWKAVHRQAEGNNLEVRAVRGTVLNPHPIHLQVDADGEAEFEVVGGVGYVPVVFHGLKSPHDRELFEVKGESTERVDQSVHGNDFWQTDYSPSRNAWSRVYNLSLDSPEDRRETRRYRLTRR